MSDRTIYYQDSGHYLPLGINPLLQTFINTCKEPIGKTLICGWVQVLEPR